MTTKLDQYRTFLTENGFQPKALPQGVIAFDFQGATFALFPEEDDPQYFRLMLPNFYRPRNPQEERAGFEVASSVTAAIKGVKVFLKDGHACAVVEFFLPDHDHFGKVLPRCLRALHAAAMRFCIEQVGRVGVGPAAEAARETPRFGGRLGERLGGDGERARPEWN